VPTVEAILAEHTSYANAMALTAFVVFTLAVIVVAVGREKKGIEFGA
jgi:cbb3-type cytochrome oxidase subunit 3